MEPVAAGNSKSADAELSATPAGPSARSIAVARGITLLGLIIFGWLILLETLDPRFSVAIGADRDIYRAAAMRFAEGGSWFFPEQVAGVPYEVIQGHIMYPPVALIWLIPGAYMPDLLWYGIPLAIIAGVVLYHRPSPWGWACIALCLGYPWSPPHLLAGNPGIWIAAACALGTIWRPAFALILAKPSLAPFALLGIRHRGWWVIAGLGVIASLLMLPFTLQWVGVVLNARGQFSGLLYGLRDIGWMLLPLVAWWFGRFPPVVPWLDRRFDKRLARASRT